MADINASDHDLLIEINQKVKSIDDCLRGLTDWQKSIDIRLRSVETQSEVSSGGISSLKTDMNSFKSKSNTLDIILGVIAVIGAILGSIFGIGSP